MNVNKVAVDFEAKSYAAKLPVFQVLQKKILNKLSRNLSSSLQNAEGLMQVLEIIYCSYTRLISKF